MLQQIKKKTTILKNNILEIQTFPRWLALPDINNVIFLLFQLKVLQIRKSLKSWNVRKSYHVKHTFEKVPILFAHFWMCVESWYLGQITFLNKKAWLLRAFSKNARLWFLTILEIWKSERSIGHTNSAFFCFFLILQWYFMIFLGFQLFQSG